MVFSFRSIVDTDLYTAPPPGHSHLFLNGYSRSGEREVNQGRVFDCFSARWMGSILACLSLYRFPMVRSDADRPDSHRFRGSATGAPYTVAPREVK